MQIPSIPPPIVTNALPQDVAAKAVPIVQATAPLAQNPVIPTPKSEKFNDQSRGNKDRGKEERHKEHGKDTENDSDQRGNSLNIRV